MFVHLADLHLGKNYKGKKFNWDLVKKVFKEICKLNPSFVLISGDLFDRPLVNNDELIETINLLNKLKNKEIKVFTIEGNHDCNNTSLSYYYLLSQIGLLNNLSSGDKIGFLRRKYESEDVKFKEIKIKNEIFYMAKGIVNEEKIKEIHGLAYIRTKEVLKILLKNFKNNFFKDKSILMLHQSVEGISGLPPEQNEIKIGELLELNYKYYALGHIHTTNLLSKNKNNYMFSNSYFVYPGSLDLTDKRMFHQIKFINSQINIKKSKTGFVIGEINESIEIKFKEIEPSPYYFAQIDFDNIKDLKEKLEKIDKVIEEGAVFLSLFSFKPINKKNVFDLIEDIIGKERLLEIDYNAVEDEKNEFLQINELESKRLIKNLINQFEIIRESENTNELKKQKILQLVKELNVDEIIKEFEEISKKNEIKKLNKEINKSIEEIKQTKESKGLLKYLKN